MTVGVVENATHCPVPRSHMAWNTVCGVGSPTPQLPQFNPEIGGKHANSFAHLQQVSGGTGVTVGVSGGGVSGAHWPLPRSHRA